MDAGNLFFQPAAFNVIGHELAVDFVRLEGIPRIARNAGLVPNIAVEEQSLIDVIKDWPEGEIPIRMDNYMIRPHQRWTVTAVPDAGGYLGAPYYKIEIAGTHRALAATADCELTSVPKYTGAEEQLWRIERLVDGTYRIMPKAIPGYTGEPLVVVSTGDSTVALGKYDFNNVNCKWDFRDREYEESITGPRGHSDIGIMHPQETQTMG